MELLDAKGQKVAESSGAEGELMVEHATLWQPGHAYLYQVRVTFGDDVYELPYDVRTVSVDGERFLINGRPFYFKGYGKHEDTFPAGRGENLPMDVKDISLMKWQGANSFRTSHYPYSIANEPDSASEGAYEYFKPLYDFARELDPQKRPCTLASVQGTTPQNDCSAKLSDVICLNR